jgi:hypothetical protein
VNRSRLVRNRRQLEALTLAEKEARERVLEAVSEARRSGTSLTRATREAGTTIATLLRYGAPAVERLPNRRYRVLPSDRLYRPIQVVSVAGLVIVDTHSSRQATLASAHARAIDKYGLSGDEHLLDPFRGKGISVYQFETDPARLAALAAAGELSPFELYAEIAR